MNYLKDKITEAIKQFNSYDEYEKAYVKRWRELHPFLSPDMNWVKKDWEKCKQEK